MYTHRQKYQNIYTFLLIDYILNTESLYIGIIQGGKQQERFPSFSFFLSPLCKKGFNNTFYGKWITFFLVVLFYEIDSFYFPSKK